MIYCLLLLWLKLLVLFQVAAEGQYRRQQDHQVRNGTARSVPVREDRGGPSASRGVTFSRFHHSFLTLFTFTEKTHFLFPLHASALLPCSLPPYYCCSATTCHRVKLTAFTISGSKWRRTCRTDDITSAVLKMYKQQSKHVNTTG